MARFQYVFLGVHSIIYVLCVLYMCFCVYVVCGV